MRHSVVLIVVLAALAPQGVAQTCGQPGSLGLPALDASSNLWDHDVDLVLANVPGSTPCAILADVLPGPTPIPGATLCVGPNPAIFLGVTTPAGTYTIHGSLGPALSILVDVPTFLQGVAADVTAPAGLALSAQLPYTVRAPRVVVLQKTPTGGREAALYDSLRLTTGTPPLIEAIPLPPMFNHQLALAPDGDLLVARSMDAGVLDRIDAYDVSVVPAAFAGSGSLPMTGPTLVELPILMTRLFGFAVTGGSVLQRFDRDRFSTSFLQPNAQLALSGAFITDLMASRSGDVVYALTADFTLGEQVEAIDAVTMTSIAIVPIVRTVPNSTSAVSLLSRITPSPDDTRLVVVLAGAGAIPAELFVFDRASLAQLAAVPLFGQGQTRAYFDPRDPTNATILFADSVGPGPSGVLYRIDWTTGAFLQSTPLGFGVPFDVKLGITPNGSFLHVADRATDSLHVFDANHNFLAMHFITPASDPVGSHFMIVEDR